MPTALPLTTRGVFLKATRPFAHFTKFADSKENPRGIAREKSSGHRGTRKGQAHVPQFARHTARASTRKATLCLSTSGGAGLLKSAGFPPATNLAGKPSRSFIARNRSDAAMRAEVAFAKVAASHSHVACRLDDSLGKRCCGETNEGGGASI